MYSSFQLLALHHRLHGVAVTSCTHLTRAGWAIQIALALPLVGCSSAGDGNKQDSTFPEPEVVAESGPSSVAVVQGRVVSSRGIPIDSVRIIAQGRIGDVNYLSSVCWTNTSGDYRCEIGGYGLPSITFAPVEVEVTAMKYQIVGQAIQASSRDTLRFVPRGQQARPTTLNFRLPFAYP